MRLKATGIAAFATLLIVAVTWIVAEGLVSIARWERQSTSVAFSAIDMVRRMREGQRPIDPEPRLDVLRDAAELEVMLPLMKAAGVGLGNTPYRELKTESSAMNYEKDGCLSLKPNLRKTAVFLRTQLFDPLDPVTAFFDADAALDPTLKEFLDRYAVSRRTQLTSNAAGERATFPLVERRQKVIVAGDSVAFGAMLDDRETIASQLQSRDATRQYISSGVGGASAADVICNLDAAAKRYQGQLDELIYVYCQNDLQPRKKFGRPEEVIDWLTHFASREHIPRVTVVYAPYVYNIAPQVTRFAGYEGWYIESHLAERRALKAAVENARFRWLDIGDLALEDDQTFGTQFAFWHFFIDHVHLSPYGVTRLVQRLTSP
jgi:hypothetical protein